MLRLLDGVAVFAGITVVIKELEVPLPTDETTNSGRICLRRWVR